MVYPEKLVLDQVSRKTSARSTTSWCSEPLQNNPSHNRETLNIQSVSSDSEKDEPEIATNTNNAM